MTKFNHLELGPNCPDEEIFCWQCPEEPQCPYSQDKLEYERILEHQSAA